MKNCPNTAFFFGIILLFMGGCLALGAESAIDAAKSDSPWSSWWLRRIIVCTSGIIYWGGVLIQARRIRRKIGRTPNLRPKGTKETLLWFGWTIVVLGWLGQPMLLSQPNETWLDRWPDPVLAFSWGAGVTLLVLGYAATLWCYAAMGAAWRIGIDQTGSSELIQSGPYRRIRHPIYSFQFVMLLGAALLLPTLVSLGLLILHFVCASVKARDEERHLTHIFGEKYIAYQTRTGKFMPVL